MEELRKTQPGGYPASELERSAQLRCQLIYEIESFYTMGKTLLDRTAGLVLLFFGHTRGCSLCSHHDLIKCRNEYFQYHSLHLPIELAKAMDALQVHVSDFRDKKITHQNNPRVSLDMAYPEGKGAYLNVGHFYPKPSDEPYQSRSLDDLMVEIDDYVLRMLSFLIANREQTALQPVEEESPTIQGLVPTAKRSATNHWFKKPR